MPTFEEIYKDSISRVEKDPGTLGVNFWLAMTAYKMMQETGSDAADHSNIDVYGEYNRLCEDTAFKKIADSFAKEPSLELMKDPAQFWAKYDAIVKDDGLETEEDIAEREKKAYLAKHAESKKAIQGIEKRQDEINADLDVKTGHEKEQLEAEKEQLAVQYEKAKDDRHKLRVDHIAKNVALSSALEKKNGLGLVTQQEVNDELAELRKEPYFNVKLEQLDEMDIKYYNDQPKAFVDSYQAGKKTFEEASKYCRNKDYKGLVDYCCSILSAGNDTPEARAISDLFASKIPKIGESKEFDPETKEFVKGVAEEIAKLSAETALNRRYAEIDAQERIRSGEFPETCLVNDDPKMVKELAHNMVAYHTDTGTKWRTLSNLYDVLIFATNDSMGHSKGMMDGEPTMIYIGGKRNEKVLETYQKNAPQFLDGMTRSSDGTSAWLRNECLFSLPQNVNGFWFNPEPPKEGKSAFEKIPPHHDKLLNSTPEQFLAYEAEQKKKLAIDAEAKTVMNNMGESADFLLKEMDKKKQKFKDTDAFKEMYAELQNFSKFGTKEYVYTGKLSDPEQMQQKSDDVSTITADNALYRLEEQAKKYAATDPAFAQKVEGLVWEKRIQYKRYLENNPLSKKDMALFDKAKEMRPELKGKVYDPSNEIKEKTEQIGGENGTLAQMKDKYKKASLRMRGSSEYKHIGEMLDEIDTHYNTMQKTEEELEKHNAQEDPCALNALLGEVIEVLEWGEALKNWDRKYLEHKIKDGQWKKNTNENADKRIDTVKGIDGFADTLIDTMKQKAALLQAKIRENQLAQAKEAQAKKETKAAVNEAPQPEQINAEVPDAFAQEKEAFADLAADIWLKNKFVASIDEALAQYPNYPEDQKKQVYEQNMPKLGEYVSANKEKLKNDEAFKGFIDNIKDKETLEQIKQLSAGNDGKLLYRLINGEKLNDLQAEADAHKANDKVDLDEKIRNAQKYLIEQKNKLGKDEYPNPGHDDIANEYGTIVTAYYFKAYKNAGNNDIDEQTFNKKFTNIRGTKLLRDVINLTKPEEVYDKATHDKGQNLWSRFNTEMERHRALKNQANEQNGNAAVNEKNAVNDKAKQMK